MFESWSRFSRPLLITVLVAINSACSGSASSAGQQEKPPVSVGQAAGIGALLGVALGRDPIVGAVQGAALGAAGGLITNAVIEGQERSDRKKAEQQRQQQAQQASAETGQDLETTTRDTKRFAAATMPELRPWPRRRRRRRTRTTRSHRCGSRR